MGIDRFISAKVLKVLIATAAAGVALLGAKSANADLIAHYQFEQGSDFLTDSTGNYPDVTLYGDANLGTSGLAPVPSGTTGHLELDGDGNAGLVDAPLLEGLSQLSVAFWARKDSLEDDGNESVFVASDKKNVFVIRESNEQEGGKGPGDHLEFRIARDQPDTDKGDWAKMVTADPVMELGTWHHVAMTYNGSNLIGYVDGEEVLNNEELTDWSTNAPEQVTLFGAGSTGDGPRYAHLDGALDDIRFYDHALTLSEVQSIAVPEPGSVALLGSALLAMGCVSLAYRRRRA